MKIGRNQSVHVSATAIHSVHALVLFRIIRAGLQAPWCRWKKDRPSASCATNAVGGRFAEIPSRGWGGGRVDAFEAESMFGPNL